MIMHLKKGVSNYFATVIVQNYIPLSHLNFDLSFISLEPEVPYDIQLVAGNGVGCGKVISSNLIFTREGG